MQISLNIQDSYFKQFMEVIKKLPNGAIEILSNQSSDLDSDTLAYMKTEQFQKDNAELQETLDDYRKNGTKNFTTLDDDFINDVEERLIKRHA